MLGIPDRSRGCLLDLDGGLAPIRCLHAAGGAGAGAGVAVRDLAELLDER